MTGIRRHATTVAFALILLASPAFAQDSRDAREARGLVESVAAGLYRFAWPSATYKSWALKQVQPVTGGLDIVTRLTGTSRWDGSDLWLELLLELRRDGLRDVRVVQHNAILVPPFVTSDAIAQGLVRAIDDYNRSKSTSAASLPNPPGSISIIAPGQTSAISSDAKYVVGVSVQTADAFLHEGKRYEYGARIIDLVSAGPAAAAGLARGDVVYQINNTPIRDSDAFVTEVSGSRGAPMQVHLARDGQLQRIAVRAIVDTRGLPRGVYIIGVSGMDGADGVVLSTVFDGGAAASAGLRAGDIVTGVAGTPVRTMQALSQAIQTGKALTVRFVRSGEVREAVVQPSFNR